MKKIVKYIFVILSLLVLAKVSFAQLSPGKLSSAHEHLEGLKNCTKCHVLREKETTSKCLACHTEIQQLLNQNRGYHSSLEAKGKKCAECHGEHHGLNFEITRFEEETFNHDLAGYTLEGKHAQLNCADCHKNEFIKSNVSQKQGGTFLGLGTECLSCHADYHQNELMNNCLTCHSQDAFLPASGFNHAETRFPLIGKHQSLECENCHTLTDDNDNRFKQFSGVQVGNCTLCHEDIHNNEFGSDCKKCHSEFSFQRAKAQSPFNHETTNFPLRGMHRAVGCKTCHKGSYSQSIEHESCKDCHADFHENQFAKNGISPDCSMCHTVENFSPAIFTIENHQQTNFPLEGAHMATPCVFCHQLGGSWNFNNKDSRCIDCHSNIHENVMDEKYLAGNDCEKCHSVDAWSEIKFNHHLTNFELFGKHREVACRDCHFIEEANGTVRQQFNGISSSCETCHEDVHFKQFRIDNQTDCERCHAFSDWAPNRFEHNDTRFKLDGEHIGLECAKCHKPTDGLIQNYIIYKMEDITCASCH